MTLEKRLIERLQQDPSLLLEFADRDRFSGRNSLYIHDKVRDFGFHVDESSTKRLQRYDAALAAFPIEKIARMRTSLSDHEEAALMSVYFDLVRSIISEIDLRKIRNVLTLSSGQKEMVSFLQSERRDFQELLSEEEERRRRELWNVIDSDKNLDYIRSYFEFLRTKCCRRTR